MLDNKDIGLWFEQNCFDSFLWTGITLAIFRMDGNTPDEKDRLNMSDRWVECHFFLALKFWLEGYLALAKIYLH